MRGTTFISWKSRFPQHLEHHSAKPIHVYGDFLGAATQSGTNSQLLQECLYKKLQQILQHDSKTTSLPMLGFNYSITLVNCCTVFITKEMCQFWPLKICSTMCEKNSGHANTVHHSYKSASLP